MKQLHILLIFVLYSVGVGFSQAEISFPLEIGNKYYYTAKLIPDNGLYAATKTITGILENGTRVISYERYYPDSITTTTEYWRYKDNRFYMSYDPTTMIYPVFDVNLLNDTCISYFNSNRCYEIYDTTLFNEFRYCQKYFSAFFLHGVGGRTNICIANGIGPYFRSDENFSGEEWIEVIDLVDYELVDPIFSASQNTFQLFQNYPNPFNFVTTINYKIMKPNFVSLKVYDSLGEEVTTLINKEKAAGSYTVLFDGSNLTSGIYFYMLYVGGHSDVMKMILLK